jgi:hypothetical protein
MGSSFPIHLVCRKSGRVEDYESRYHHTDIMGSEVFSMCYANNVIMGGGVKTPSSLFGVWPPAAYIIHALFCSRVMWIS